MKKIFSITVLLALIFTLVACGPADTPPVNDDATATISNVGPVTINVGDTFDPLAGVTATDTVDGDITSRIDVTENTVLTNTAGTYTVKYAVVGSDGKTVTATRTVTVTPNHTTPPTEIVIMHGAPYEIDPFDPAYSGREQQARQNKQREVEGRLNVKVVYKAYPANAPWGPDRVNAIIQASVSGSPLADIYWTTSDWTQQLAKGNAIVPVDKYMSTHGSNISIPARELGTYNDKFYAFSVNKPTVDVGLYYNADVVEALGIDNPSELFNAGTWTWNDFQAWTQAANAALPSLGEDYSVLGGIVGVYAENMVPLNGGALINAQSGRVAFHQNPALQTYDFITNLYNSGLFEATPTYDAGSAQWQAGKVLMHPGSFWFLNAENRWKNLAFNLGFVPFPVSNTYTGEYVSPISGVAVFNLASGLSAAKEELAFQVWNEIQMWKTDEEFRDEFEVTLIQRFNDEASIEAYLSIFDKTTLDLINALGISRYGANGWTAAINVGIRTGTARTEMDRIRPAYETALEEYLSGV